MKQFFKFLTASCLGIFISVMLFFLFFLIIGVFSGPTQKSIKSNSILQMDLTGTIPEQSNNVEIGIYNGSEKKAIGIHKIRQLIEVASSDSKISGILIKNGISGGGPVTALLLRQAMQNFKESGKFIYTYSDYLGQGSYFLATVSDSIFLNPNGAVDLRGFAINGTFYKKAADQLGIKLNTFYHGKYKGASEPYRRTNFSDDNRYQLSEYLIELKQTYFELIAEERNMDFETINSIAEEYKSINADSAIQLNLVDKLIFESDFEIFLKENIGLNKSKELNLVDLEEYSKTASTKKSNKSKNKIAIIYSEGEIHMSGENKGEITVDRYQSAFDAIRKDKEIKAVVLRVNSPGGSAFESDVFLHEIDKLKDAGKYVAVSMGDYAASGGYYISCHADTIVANPLSLTGSIGVVSMIPDFTELLSEKIGITFDVVKTNKYADAFGGAGQLTEDIKRKFQKSTDEVYNQFVNEVALGRNMSYQEVDLVANGRVWSGKDAQEIGLVDVLGDLRETLEIVAERLEFEDYKTLHYPRIKIDPWEEFFRELINSSELVKVKPKIQIESDLIKWIEQTKSMADGSPKMIFPYRLEF